MENVDLSAGSKGVVAVLGASSKPDRYSNQAVVLLRECGYCVIPVTPAGGAICGIEACKSLADIECKVDTLTLYVNAMRSGSMLQDIVDLEPARIIFNPGTENSELEQLCTDKGIECVQGCTLVMLKTGQF